MTDVLDSAPDTRSRQQLDSLIGTAITVLARCRRSDLASVVAALRVDAADHADAPPAVVVVGETKRGKSSLINALMRRGRISPVDIDITTSTYLVFRYAQERFARVHLQQRPDPEEISIDAVEEWVTVAGNPGNERQVAMVEVGIDAPLLRHLTLIDTPGVGGLEAGHAELTLRALADADALLFVVDAAAPLSATELAFLRKAAERIETVVIVLTKVDLHRGWERIEHDDRLLLEMHARRFARTPIIPVSSTLAERAVTQSDPVAGRELLREAGFDRLLATLRSEVVARGSGLRMVNQARNLRSLLEIAERSCEELARAAGGDPSASAALEASKLRWRQLSTQRAEWSRRLDVDMRRINADRSDELSAEIARLRSRYLELAGTLADAELEALPDQVMSDLAALSDRLGARCRERVAQAAAAILGPVEDQAALFAAIQGLAVSALREEGALPVLRGRKPTSQDKLMTLSRLTTGHSLVYMLALVPGLSIVLVPLGFGAGVATALVDRKGRARQARQNALRTWVTQQLADAQTFLNNQFNLQMLSVGEQVGDALRDYIDQREHELTADLDAQRGSMEAERDAAQARRQELIANLGRLRDLMRHLDEFIAELRRSSRGAAEVQKTPSHPPARVPDRGDADEP